MSKIRIGYFYNNKDFGGPVINVRNYTRFIDKCGYFPIVFFSKHTADLDFILSEYAREQIPVHFISHIRPSLSSSFSEYVYFFFQLPIVLFKMTQLIKKAQIDIVHTNTIGDIQAMLAAKIAKKPLIVTIREIYVKPKFAVELLAWFVYMLADEVTCVSQEVKDVMFCFIKDKSKVRVINNGIDKKKYLLQNKPDISIHQQYQIKPETKIVGTIGLLDPWKGHHVIVEAVPLILKKQPDVVFVFVGKESQHARYGGYKSKMISRAKELGVDKQIIFTGFREDIGHVVSSFDIFVHASISPDPFPTTVLEAMAMGKPIIASNSGGVKEQIENGVDGILVEPGDVYEIAEKIIFLLSNPRIAIDIGEKAQKSCERKFRWTKIIRQIEQVYTDVYSV